MKKHPAIKFILILIISGACGASFSIFTMRHYDLLETAIKSVSDFLSQYGHILHIAVCLTLSLVQALMILNTRKKLAAANLDNDDEICEQIDKKCSAIMTVGSLELISNLFLFSTCIVYAQPLHVLISCVALIVFIIFNAWAEVSQINIAKKLESRFNNIDPMSMKFHKDWENTSDEAEKYTMYKAGFRAYRAVSRTILVIFTVCLLIQMIHPIGLVPFIVLAALWAVQNLSYIKACSESNNK